MEPPQKDELLFDGHRALQASLFGHVPKPQPCLVTDLAPGPQRRANIWSDQPKDGPHRRRLPCTV